jgi:hypothetical protein
MIEHGKWSRVEHRGNARCGVGDRMLKTNFPQEYEIILKNICA